MHTFHWLKDVRKSLIFLFAITLAVKVIVFIIGVTDNRFSDYLGIPDLFAVGEVEAFRDYGTAYLPTINAFKSGYTPYVDFWYAYPPLFLYLLTGFSYLPFGFWGPALPILLLDVGSVLLVYLIGLKFLSEKWSLIGALLFAFAPINLFYNNYLWLNPPLVTFFTLLAAYSFLSKRYELAALALGVSVGFKQTSLILFPVAFMVLYKRTTMKQALKFLLVFVVTIVIVSLPYLVTETQYYIGCLSAWRISLGARPEFEPEYYERAAAVFPTNTTDTELTYPIRGNSPLNGGVPIFALTSRGLNGEDLFRYYGDFSNIASFILQFALFASFGLLLFKILRSKDKSDRTTITFLLLSLILFTSFYERGVYKYYFATITPFMVLLMSSKNRSILFLLFNITVLLIPRFLSPWSLLPILIYIVLKPYLKTLLPF